MQALATVEIDWETLTGQVDMALLEGVSLSPAVTAVLTLPAEMTVSQWAARFREFPKDASIPGRWNNDFAPYAMGPMDAFTDPRVERITLMASARSVKTEIMLNMMGYVICQDPGPILWVGPTEKSVKRACRRIQRMIKESPELAKHLTGNPDDLQKKSIILDNLEIIFATAGSASDLGEFEARYIFEDETDKYPPDVEGQGSPTQMAEIRARTFWNRKIITACTPTINDAFINTDYEHSDRRHYWVPCLKCSKWQILEFWQVKHRGEPLGAWPKDKRGPDYIRLEGPAVYECRHCQAELEQVHIREMVRQGEWRPEGWRGGAGEVPPLAFHVGYHWNALYSPFASLAEIATKFWEVKKDSEKYQTFVNLWLGLPWKEIVESQPASYILSLRTRRPALVVPEETLALTAGIDSQRRGFWVVIRAWVLTAEGLRESHKIRHGWVASFGELEKWLFEDVYRSEGGQVEHRVWTGLIDTGGGLMGEGEATLTEQVYNWLRRSGRNRIFGSKGSSKPLHGRLWVRSVIEHYPSGKPLPGGLVLYRLDTAELKEFIFARIKNGLFHLDGGPELSMAEEEIPEEDKVYAAHLAAEVKERRKGKVIWTVQKGRANHLLDCEVMAAAAAEAFNVWLLPRPQPGGQVQAEAESDKVNPFTGQRQGDWLR
jgi:phage terminase large subunit GpA-like protein